MWLTLVVIALAVAFVYFVGRLIFVVVGASRVVRRASRQANEQLQSELRALSTEEIRSRLLHESYFTDALRQQPSIQQFLSRVERGDEVALAREYPRGKLYRMLATAETAPGSPGRPEAVDAIGTISGLLSELARRSTGSSA
jgi:hypothetical protein